MLKIKKAAVLLGEADIMELERIIIDQDKDDAFVFLKKSIYDKVAHSQQGECNCHQH